MKATAHVAHSLRGRTRFRVRGRRHDKQFFGEVERRLSSVPEVKSVEADPRTGSVLVHHTGSTLDLLVGAASLGLDELVEFAPMPPPVAGLVRAEIAALDRAVKNGTAGQLDLTIIAAFGLFAMAGYQFFLGTQPVLAVSLAWYASELLRRWEHPEGNSPQ
jgi:hypothetical protein